MISLISVFLRDVQKRRSMFQQARSEEVILKKTTEFVENYLNDGTVWNQKEKEQNLLTYEVCVCVCV